MHSDIATVTHRRPCGERKPAADPETLLPGARVGAWRIGHELGRGGMSTVYAVVHAGFGKRAALKVAHADIIGPRFPADRFLLEARIVHLVDHHDVVDIFDTGHLPDGRPYLVMDRLDGQTLAERLDDGPIARDDVFEIALALCGVLGTAHGVGIVHRDLKLDNIFLEDPRPGLPPRIKVLDWGVARIMGTGDPMSDVIAGTPRYLAPEQVIGEPVTPSSDIYSLGVVLYELLLGAPPFPGKSSTELLDQHVNDPPPRPRDRWPDVPRPLERAMLAMLAKEPRARPPLADIVRALIDARDTLRERRRLAAVRAGHAPATTPLEQVYYAPPPIDVLGRTALAQPWMRRWWLAVAVTLGLIASGVTWRVFGAVAGAPPAHAASISR